MKYLTILLPMVLLIIATYFRLVDGTAGFFTIPATIAIIYLVFRLTNSLIAKGVR